MTRCDAHIRADGPAWTFVSVCGEETPLPPFADLKNEVLSWLTDPYRVGDDKVSDAVRILETCELAYEVAAEVGPGVVVVTDDDSAWWLSDEKYILTWDVVSALMEACPDLRGFRASAWS